MHLLKYFISRTSYRYSIRWTWFFTTVCILYIKVLMGHPQNTSASLGACSISYWTKINNLGEMWTPRGVWAVKICGHILWMSPYSSLYQASVTGSRNILVMFLVMPSGHKPFLPTQSPKGGTKMTTLYLKELELNYF